MLPRSGKNKVYQFVSVCVCVCVCVCVWLQTATLCSATPRLQDTQSSTAPMAFVN